MVFKIYADGEDTGLTTPDISYQQFCSSPLFDGGSSDTRYADYLRANGMAEVDDFEDISSIDLLYVDKYDEKHWFRAAIPNLPRSQHRIN